MKISSHHDLAKRIRAEYLEMPDMRLTVGQVERLCGIDPPTCQMVLDSLVDAKFLRLHQDGTYARLTDATARRRAAKANLAGVSHLHWPRAS